MLKSVEKLKSAEKCRKVLTSSENSYLGSDSKSLGKHQEHLKRIGNCGMALRSVEKSIETRFKMC